MGSGGGAPKTPPDGEFATAEWHYRPAAELGVRFPSQPQRPSLSHRPPNRLTASGEGLGLLYSCEITCLTSGAASTFRRRFLFNDTSGVRSTKLAGVAAATHVPSTAFDQRSMLALPMLFK